MRTGKKQLRVLYRDTVFSASFRQRTTVKKIKTVFAEQLKVGERDLIVVCEGKRLGGEVKIAEIAEFVELIVCNEGFVWLITSEQESYIHLDSLEKQINSPDFLGFQLFHQGVALDLCNLSASKLQKRAKVLGVREGELLVKIDTATKCRFLIAQSFWTIEDLRTVLSAKIGVDTMRLQLLLGKQTLQNEAALIDLDLALGLRLVCPGDVVVSVFNARKCVGVVHLQGSCLTDRLIAQAAFLLNTVAASTLLVYKNQPIAPLQPLLPYCFEVGDRVEAYTDRDKVVYGRYGNGELVCGLAASTPPEIRLALGLTPCIRLLLQGKVVEDTETLRLPTRCIVDLARPTETLFPILHASGYCQVAVLPKAKNTVSEVKTWLSRRLEKSVYSLKLCRAGRILPENESVSPSDVLEILKENDVLVRVESTQHGDIFVCIPESALVAELKERIRVKTGISVKSQRLISYTWLEDRERLDFYGIVGEARVYLKMQTDLLISAYADSRTVLILASPTMRISCMKKQIQDRLESLEVLKLAVEGVELQEEWRLSDYGIGEDCRVEIVQKGDRVIRLESPTEETLLIKFPSKCESLSSLHTFIETKTGISVPDQHLIWSGCLKSGRTLQDYQMTGELTVSLIKRPRYLDEVRISFKPANKRKFSTKISLSSPVSLLRKLGRIKKVDPTILVIPGDVVLQDSKPLYFYDLKAQDIVQIADPAEAVVTVVEPEEGDSWVWLVRKETTIATLKTRIVKYPANVQILSLAEKSLSDETFLIDLGLNQSLRLFLRPGTILLIQPKQLPTILSPGYLNSLEDLHELIEKHTGISRGSQRIYHSDQLVLDIAVFRQLSESGICLQLLSTSTDIRLKLQTASGTSLYIYASLSDSIELTKQTIGKRVGLSPEGLDLVYSTELRKGDVGMLLRTVEEKEVELAIRKGTVWVLIYKGGLKVLRVEKGATMETIRGKADLLCGKSGLQLSYNGRPVESTTDLPLLALVHAN